MQISTRSNPVPHPSAAKTERELQAFVQDLKQSGTTGPQIAEALNAKLEALPFPPSDLGRLRTLTSAHLLAALSNLPEAERALASTMVEFNLKAGSGLDHFKAEAERVFANVPIRLHTIGYSNEGLSRASGYDDGLPNRLLARMSFDSPAVGLISSPTCDPPASTSRRCSPRTAMSAQSCSRPRRLTWATSRPSQKASTQTGSSLSPRRTSSRTRTTPPHPHRSPTLRWFAAAAT